MSSTRIRSVTFMALAGVGAAAGLAIAGTGGSATPAMPEPTVAHAEADGPVRFDDADLFIEINATDGDAGLQARIGAEPWRRVIILDPRGRKLVDFRGRGRMAQWGLSELSFESAEPSFDEVPFAAFRARFPVGRYRFRGRTIDNELVIGSARLSHVVPARPKVLSPTEGAVVPVGDLTVRWEPVTRPAKVEIIDYEVILGDDRGETVSIELTPDATSLTLPGELLAPGTQYALEVLAREKSGNRTITEIGFRTEG